MRTPGSRLPWLIAIGALVVASFALGASRGGDRSSAPATATSRDRPSPSSGRAPIVVRDRHDRSLSDAARAEIRAALRDELAAHHAPADEQADDAVDESPTDEQQQVAEDAHSLLDDTIGSGVMTIHDHGYFHGMLAELPASEQRQLLGRWVAAINAQQLRVEH